MAGEDGDGVHELSNDCGELVELLGDLLLEACLTLGERMDGGEESGEL